jgi:hypothetical protein
MIFEQVMNRVDFRGMKYPENFDEIIKKIPDVAKYISGENTQKLWYLPTMISLIFRNLAVS